MGEHPQVPGRQVSGHREERDFIPSTRALSAYARAAGVSAAPPLVGTPLRHAPSGAPAINTNVFVVVADRNRQAKVDAGPAPAGFRSTPQMAQAALERTLIARIVVPAVTLSLATALLVIAVNAVLIGALAGRILSGLS